MEGYLPMKMLLLLLGMVMLIGLVSAGTDLGAGNYSFMTCYQETANISTSCGGLNTGKYYTTTPLTAYNINNSYDADWNSYGYFTATPGGRYDVNYTVPGYAINLTTNTIQIRRLLNGTFMNITVPKECVLSDKLSFHFTGSSIAGGPPYSNHNYYYCYNRSTVNDMILIYSHVGPDSNDNIAYFYEEGMYWSRSDYILVENNQSFNSNTLESKQEQFSINLTYDDTDYPIINADLVYNNTRYPATKSGSNTNYTFNKTLTIPFISNETLTFPFYWEIAITNTTGTYYYNSSFNNQTVNAISLGECNVTTILNYTALNFTAYDEQTLTRVNPFNIKGTLNYYLSSPANSKNFSFTNLGIAEKDICIPNNLNFSITGQIQYSADGYTTTDYNFVNHIINNVTQNISLYLLNSTTTIPFILKVQSQNQLPISDYYIYVYRYDAGDPTPYLVQVTKTDESGQTIGYFEVYTVDYKFVIENSDGNVVYTSTVQKIIPTSTPYTITFTVGSLIPSPFSYYNNLTGMTWNLGYNKATYVASLGYSDSNSSFSSALFIVKSMNYSGPNNVLCNKTLNNSAGILTCDLTGNMSGTYFSEFYVDRGSGYTFVDRLSFNIEGISAVTGMLGMLGAFFIILIFGFAFAFDTTIGIISTTFGFVLCNILGLLKFGIIGCSAVIGVAILILVVMEWG